MEEIIKAFDNQPLTLINNRKYIVNPLLDHMPETKYELLEDVVLELSKLTSFDDAQKIVGEEDRGGYIAALMAYEHKKSLAMVKWNPSGLQSEHPVDFRNAYTSGKMYLHGIKKGDRVILVEDLIDSGGTIIAMIKLLQDAGAVIVDIITVAEKIDYDGRERIKNETGFDVKSLLKVQCLDEKSKVIL